MVFILSFCTLNKLGLGVLSSKFFLRPTSRDFLRAIARGVAPGGLAPAPAGVRSRSVARRIVGRLARDLERARGSSVGRARGEGQREANERFAREGTL
jgi:hypothetical protein